MRECTTGNETNDIGNSLVEHKTPTEENDFTNLKSNTPPCEFGKKSGAACLIQKEKDLSINHSNGDVELNGKASDSEEEIEYKDLMEEDIHMNGDNNGSAEILPGNISVKDHENLDNYCVNENHFNGEQKIISVNDNDEAKKKAFEEKLMLEKLIEMVQNKISLEKQKKQSE